MIICSIVKLLEGIKATRKIGSIVWWVVITYTRIIGSVLMLVIIGETCNFLSIIISPGFLIH